MVCILCILILTACEDQNKKGLQDHLVTRQIASKIINQDQALPPEQYVMPKPTKKRVVLPEPIPPKPEKEIEVSKTSIKVVFSGNESIKPGDGRYPETYTAEGHIKPLSKPRRIPVNNQKIMVDGPTMVIDKDDGLPLDVVGGLFQDNEGAIWGCSRWGGAWKYDGTQMYLYNEAVGLPDYSVVNMLHDRDGDIWFGMSIGLIKYDGYTFTNYSATGSISGEKPTKLLQDNNGIIWVGTNEGIYCINKKTNQITHINSNNGLQQDQVSGLMMDQDNQLWITYNRVGLSILRMSGNDTNLEYKYTHYKAPDNNFRNVQCMQQGKDGIVYIGFDGYFMIIDPAFVLSQQDKMLNTYRIEVAGMFFVYALAEDRKGNIYIGSEQGLYKIEIRNGENLESIISMNDLVVKPTAIIALKIDRENDLWVSNLTGNICRIDLDTSFDPINELYGVTSKLFDIEKDKMGNLWMAGIRGELLCLKNVDVKIKREMYDLTDQLGHNNSALTGIEVDSDGNVWVSNKTSLKKIMFGNSLNDISCEIYDLKDAIPITHIVGMMIDHKDQIWLSDNTVNVVDKSLASYGGGAFRIDRKKIYKYGKAQGLMGDDTYSICQDSDHNYWFNSTFQGISKYEPGRSASKDRWIHYDSDLIQKISFSVQHFMDDGIYFSGRGENMQIPSMVDTPFQDVVILEASARRSNSSFGNITENAINTHWMGVDIGVAKVNRQMDESGRVAYSYEKYTALSGFRRDKNTAARFVDQSEIYLTSKNNFMKVDVENLKQKTPVSSAVLQEVNLFSESIDWSSRLGQNDQSQRPLTAPEFDELAQWSYVPKNLSLDYRDNYISFDYSTNNVTNPHKLEYRYYLEGYENDWNIPTQSTTAQYPNLSSGKYKLHLQSRVKNRLWSEETVYDFRIRPPWWWTWWAYLVYAIVIGVLIYGMYRYLLSQRLAKEESARLKEIDTLKSRLYTNITHEFRTPLTVISGMASQMKANPEKWFASGVNMIERNTNRLLNLVNQMLDLSKIEDGKLKINNKQGDVVNFIKYLVESMHSYSETKDIKLHFHADSEEIMMDFDSEKIQKVITNILTNAVKYTLQDGHVYLFLRRIRNTAKDDELLITIKDTGIGIAEEHQPFVFDRFYQVNDTNTRPGEGSGVGLALTKELILLMNGSIDLRSVLGEGSEFKIHLPITNISPTVPRRTKKANSSTTNNRIQSNEERIKDTKPKLREDTITKAPSHLPKILIVEDNADVVSYIASCLDTEYDLTVGINGQEGIDMAISDIPDLIITDIMMPEVDGLELCAHVKSKKETSHIPIIMLTAKSGMESKLDGLRRGADAYLGKPFHKEELLVRIQSLLENRKQLQSYYLSKALGQDSKPSSAPRPQLAEDKFIIKIREVVADNYQDFQFSADRLAIEMRMSKSQIHRKVTALLGMSTIKYIRFFRLEQAKILLTTTNDKIAAVALEVGYEDSGYFSRLFKKEVGMTPVQYRSDRN